jgi:threonine synthase
VTSYVSTRGSETASLREAVLQGMSPRGGLYVPTQIPTFDWPPPEGSVAEWLAPSLFPSLEPDVARRIAQDACDFPFPLVQIDDSSFILELFHGPTHAFKDVGARFMADLVSLFATGSGNEITVLVATSGDTGGAVANAFFGRRGTRVVAVFPLRGVSETQRRQMTTLGDNVEAVAVEGTFDDCQRMVKECFSDPSLSARHGLTSANSINVARLLPQAVYYLEAARRFREPVHFVVPSGNLGNLCAGLIASKGGMPHAGFTAAFNRNHGVADLLQGGPFETRDSIRTLSNAMDVGNPSNLERIQWLYKSDDALRVDVGGDWVSDEDTVRAIASVHRREGYVMDPHTAVAFAVAQRLDAGVTPVVILSTAHPAKFPEVVEDAICESVSMPETILSARQKNELMSVIPPDLGKLKELLEGGRQ